MRRANIISGTMLVVVCLFSMVFVVPAQIDPGPEGMMSPRLVPNMMLGLIACLAGLLIVTNIRDTDVTQDQTPPISRSEFAALLKIGAVFAVAIAAYKWIGPAGAGVAVISGGLVMLGERRVWVILLMPLVLLGVTYLLFYRLLGTAIL